jgi:hypothetical protein
MTGAAVKAFKLTPMTPTSHMRPTKINQRRYYIMLSVMNGMNTLYKKN